MLPGEVSVYGTYSSEGKAIFDFNSQQIKRPKADYYVRPEMEFLCALHSSPKQLKGEEKVFLLDLDLKTLLETNVNFYLYLVAIFSGKLSVGS